MASCAAMREIGPERVGAGLGQLAADGDGFLDRRQRLFPPPRRSHSRTVLSSPQLASSPPSGLKATLHTRVKTAPLRPVRVRWCSPVAGSHSRTVLSLPQLASSRRSGLNATPLIAPVWPVRVRWCSPVAGSHSRTVLSLPQLASSRRSGLN